LISYNKNFNDCKLHDLLKKECYILKHNYAFIVELITVAVRMKEFPHQHFGLVFLPLIAAIPKKRDKLFLLRISGEWTSSIGQSRYCFFFCLDAKETKDISVFVVVFKGAYEIASLSSRKT
jgi:hypothetical protein